MTLELFDEVVFPLLLFVVCFQIQTDPRAAKNCNDEKVR